MIGQKISGMVVWRSDIERGSEPRLDVMKGRPPAWSMCQA